MILKQKKNNKNRWYRGRNRSKNVKNANLLFWGAFFGGKKQLFFQKLQSSNCMNNMNRCMWLKIISCASSYVYRAKQVKKRQKRKNVNFRGKFGGQKPIFPPKVADMKLCERFEWIQSLKNIFYFSHKIHTILCRTPYQCVGGMQGVCRQRRSGGLAVARRHTTEKK